ncbi:MAG TPA: TAT-variant-translocated molybdopterin oxidoreductase, partial [candidate division Zixibacteria bacterium]|nr:TAT-variant-translocated molybdopterin oxidoreductase [candidate division Zixibacteria bacterium]
MSPLKSETQQEHPRKRYWRSVDQLAETPEFTQFVEREFPEGASELNDPMSRRKFLGLMGASMALAGLVSCRRPVQKIVPYVIQPEHLTPGVPQYYATAMPLGLSAYGLLVECHEGR